MEQPIRFNSAQNDFENQQLIDQTVLLLRNPKHLFSEAKKVGGKGVGRIALIVSLFTLVNVFFILQSIVRLAFLGDASLGKYLLLVLIIGIIATSFATSKAYKYAVIKAFGVVYKKMTPFFQKICAVIIEKSEKVIQNADEAKEGKLKEVMDFGLILQSVFKNLPGFAQKIIVKMLNKTPIPEMVIELKQDISEGRRDEASAKLHLKIDNYLTDSYFNQNTTNWVLWLLPLNIALQYVIIHFLM